MSNFEILYFEGSTCQLCERVLQQTTSALPQSQGNHKMHFSNTRCFQKATVDVVQSPLLHAARVKAQPAIKPYAKIKPISLLCAPTRPLTVLYGD